MLKPIRTEEEYRTAILEVSSIMDKQGGLTQDETDRLELQVLLCECYENNRYPVSYARKLRLKTLAIAIASEIGKQNLENNEKMTAEPPATEAKSEFGPFRCISLKDGVRSLPRKPNLPSAVYEPGDLEHPAIPGLLLTREQRLYGAAIEYENVQTGERALETLHQKRFRVFWQKPVPLSASRTADSFVKMDLTLFKKT